MPNCATKKLDPTERFKSYTQRLRHFSFRKLDSNLLYNTYSNRLNVNYYVSILGAGGGGLCLCLLGVFRGGGARIWENMVSQYLNAP